MKWIQLETANQVEEIRQRSSEIPCLIFKHSTRCSVSSIAKFRLESDWPFEKDEVEPYFLDLIANREISNKVASLFQVHHESPQIILLWMSEVLLDASHLDISTDEIRETLNTQSAISS